MYTFNLIFKYTSCFPHSSSPAKQMANKNIRKTKIGKAHLFGTFVDSNSLTLMLFNSYLDFLLSGNLEKLFYSSAKNHLKFEY